MGETYQTDNSVDYKMDPQQLRLAAGSLIRHSDTMQTQYTRAWDVSLAAERAIAGVGIPDKLADLANQWNTTSYSNLCRRVEHLGQFLAAHAETMMTVDSFNADMFDRYADPDTFDTDGGNSSDEPIAVDENLWMS